MLSGPAAPTSADGLQIGTGVEQTLLGLVDELRDVVVGGGDQQLEESLGDSDRRCDRKERMTGWRPRTAPARRPPAPAATRCCRSRRPPRPAALAASMTSIDSREYGANMITATQSRRSDLPQSCISRPPAVAVDQVHR
jgi:hypothetical protein